MVRDGRGLRAAGIRYRLLLGDLDDYPSIVPRSNRAHDRADGVDGMALLAYYPPGVFLSDPQFKNRHCLGYCFLDLDRFGLGDQRFHDRQK